VEEFIAVQERQAEISKRCRGWIFRSDSAGQRPDWRPRAPPLAQKGGLASEELSGHAQLARARWTRDGQAVGPIYPAVVVAATLLEEARREGFALLLNERAIQE